MNESDCEELMNSICDKIFNLINDEIIKTELINDLKLINNSYKSIIGWKKRQILKLNNELTQMNSSFGGNEKQLNCIQNEKTNTLENNSLNNNNIKDKQIISNNINNNINQNNLFSFASDLIHNRKVDNNLCLQNQTNCLELKGIEQNSSNNSIIDFKLNETTINSVDCVQSLSVGNDTIDCIDMKDDSENDDNSLNDCIVLSTNGNNSYAQNDFDLNCTEFESKAGGHCRSLVWKYFRHDSTNNITYCLVKDCTSKGIRGKLAGNLKRHLRTHSTEYNRFTKAVNRLELNIDKNKKLLNKSSIETIIPLNSNELNEEKSFDLFEVNEYLDSSPKEDSAADVVYTYRRSTIGRKYESTVWKFFNYSPNTNVAYCLVANCKSKGIRGKLAGNLRKHLLTHKREFDERIKSRVFTDSIGADITKTSICILPDCDNTGVNPLEDVRQQTTTDHSSNSHCFKRNTEQNCVELNLNYNKRIKSELNHNFIALE